MRITDLVPWRGSDRDVVGGTTATDPVRALQLDVDRAFDHFWSMLPYPIASFGRLELPESVRVDVSDTGQEITVTAELPGVSEADIDVSVTDGTLTIRGVKKFDREAEENGVLVKERDYGAVERTVSLPRGIVADAAKATFNNGVLTIVIPKAADVQSETKRIQVQAG